MQKVIYITITDAKILTFSAPTVIESNPPDSVTVWLSLIEVFSNNITITNQGRGYVQPNGNNIYTFYNIYC